jgi:S-formylglutathione hydrolase FrmB
MALLAVSLYLALVAARPACGQQPLKDAAEHGRASHATLQDATFHSESLNRQMHYRVLLPPDYDLSARRYPTLYLLHGLYGDYQNWTTRTDLVHYAGEFNLIIAMPDAGNSWYVNSATNPADKYEDYIVKDFIAEIDLHFRTIRERYARAIAGLSMGGYAAVKFGLKYPQLFSYAGGISGALNAPGDLDKKVSEIRGDLQEAFGPHGDPTRAQNDVFSLLSQADVHRLPYFYLDCGTDDSFLETNRQLAAGLQQKKIPYEFHEMPGAHTWDYWNAAIRRFLDVLVNSNFADHTIRRQPECR